MNSRRAKKCHDQHQIKSQSGEAHKLENNAYIIIKMLHDEFCRPASPLRVITTECFMEHVLYEKYIFPRNLNLRNLINKCLTTCVICQTAVPSPGRKMIPSKIMEQVGINVVAMPLREGFKYIALGVDYVSKWVEAEPIRNKCPEEVTEFVREVVFYHCIPYIQINDHDHRFVMKLTKSLHRVFPNIFQIITRINPHYNHLGDELSTIVINKLQMTLIRNIETWPTILPKALFALRTFRNKNTNVSPFEIIYKRQPNFGGMDMTPAKIKNGGFIKIQNVSLKDNDDVTNNVKSKTMMKKLKHKKDYRTEHELTMNKSCDKDEGNLNMESAKTKQHIEQVEDNTQMKSTAIESITITKEPDDGAKDHPPMNADKGEGDNIKPMMTTGKQPELDDTAKSQPTKVKFSIKMTEEQELVLVDCDIQCNTTQESSAELSTSGQQTTCCVGLSATNVNNQYLVAQQITNRTLYTTENIGNLEIKNQNEVSQEGNQLIETLMYFKPVTGAWQEMKCLELGIPFHSQFTCLRFGQVLPLRSPLQVKRIIDGNWFKAVGCAVSGDEECHSLFRNLVVEYMAKLQHGAIVNEAYKSNVLLQIMEQDGVLATNAEIFATASMLDVNVYVYTRINPSSDTDQRCAWKIFRKDIGNTFQSDKQEDVLPSLYFTNESGNHYDIVLSVTT